jgi:hypothetical protein
MVRRGELPCVRRLRTLHIERVVCGAVLMPLKKKVMKQRRRREKKSKGK